MEVQDAHPPLRHLEKIEQIQVEISDFVEQSNYGLHEKERTYVDRKRTTQEEAMQLVVCGVRRPGQYNWEARTESWSYKTARTAEKQKVLRAHATPNGVCDNLINALKHLANLQKDGDGPVSMVVQGLREKSTLKITDGLRRFIMVENFETVRVGGLEKNMESTQVVKPNFTTDFLQEADEWSLRKEEEGTLRSSIDTTSVGDNKWELPLVDEDWHAIVWSFSMALTNENGRPCLNNYKELHHAVKCKISGENKNAKGL